MNSKYRLPVFSDEALSGIIFGMEDQENEYVLNVRDGNAYRSDMLNELFDNPENEVFVPIPTWTSADGYQLMVSFVRRCTDKNLKDVLNRQLSMKAKGVFRRFKATLEESGAIQTWYDFKDRKMKAHIVSWYSSRPGLFTTEEETESSDEEEESSSLLVDFDVKISDMTEEVRAYVENCLLPDTMYGKMYGALNCDRAACIVQKKICGVIPFSTEGERAIVPYYYIEEKLRGLGLFRLLFDQLCRYLKREKITEVVMVSNEGNASFRMLDESDVSHKSVAGIFSFRLDDWTSSTRSSDLAYLI